MAKRALAEEARRVVEQRARAVDVFVPAELQNLPVFLLGLLQVMCLIPREPQIALEIQSKR